MPKAKKAEEFEVEAEPTLEERAVSIPSQARRIVVQDAESWRRASEMLAGIKALRREIDETLDPVVKKAHEAHRAAVAAKKKVEGPLVDAETYLRGDMARHKREIDEANAQARRAAEQARRSEIIALEERGDLEAADAVRTAPVPVAEAPATEGVSTRSIWRAEVEDLALLVKAVADGRVPLSVVQVDQKVLGGLARSLRGALDYPGVRVWEDVGIVVK